MERWERSAAPPRRGGAREKPSFSSTLLDAIYRSIDDDSEPNSSRAREPCLPTKKQSSTIERKNHHAAVSEKAVLRHKYDRRAFTIPTTTTTSSSSDCSSYGGFSSSSEAESRLRPIRTGLDRSRSDPPPPPPPKKAGSLGRRFRDLRKAKAPASPGARLATFLNSLFKAKVAAPAEEPASSTARSCLSKTASTRERPATGVGLKRTVRFDPVSVVVGDDCRPCGQKCLYGGDTVARPPATSGRLTKDRVEELLRRFKAETAGDGDGDDDDGASDSSSDLFELDNLKAGIGGGGGGRGGGGYRDELPVYETTHFRTHRGSSLRV